MPFTNILILTGIILAFVIFGVSLAWADDQCRQVDRDAKSRNAADKTTDLKKAAR